MLTRWTPSTYPTQRDPMTRLMDAFLNGTLGQSEEVSNRTWMPPVDIQETEEAFVLSAELPGLTKKDIEISIENSTLRLSGERKFERNVDKENYHRVERAYGSFSRSFSLPSQIDAEKVDANFKDGVLTITIPKAEHARPRRIAIK